MTIPAQRADSPDLRPSTCIRCGADWLRPWTAGQRPTICPECFSVASSRRMDPAAAGYQLAVAVVDYRLAIEIATSALRIGRVAEALAVLETVEAPTRHT